MTKIPVAPEVHVAHTGHDSSRKKLRNGFAASAVTGLALCLVLSVHFADDHWPYRYRIVKPLLEEVLGSQIVITHYHRTYFPHPGFVAEGIRLRRKSAPDLSPLGSVEQLAVQGTWVDLFLLRKRVKLVDIQRLHIVVPALGSRANKEDFPPGSASDFAGPDTLIEQLKVHDGLLDILRANGTRFSFPVKELDLRAFRKGLASDYTVVMDNAVPGGHIHSWGRFGPLNADNLDRSPASGSFSFAAVRLSDIGEPRGTLNSSGSFRGALGALEAMGTAETRDFAVSDGRPTALSGSIRCTINSLTGEIVIHDVEVRSGATIARASGAIAGAPKIANLNFAAQGRAQDVIRPFVHSEVPIAGPVSLHGHAWVSPSRDGIGFLQRLRVDGVFDVPAEVATDPATEKRITEIGRHAEIHDDDPHADALLSLQGPVQIRDAIASSPHLTFRVAGAQATLRGTFNFRNEAVDLTGDLATQSGLSHSVTGFKSVLLKPFDPFFRRGNAGAVIPIRVNGGPGQYHVTQNLLHKK